MFKRIEVTLSVWLLLTLAGATIDRLDELNNGYFFLSNQKNIESILQKMKEYRHKGLISQLDKDMGDTLQRTGSYYTLLKFLGAETDDLDRPIELGYNEDMKQLTSATGIYRRSNDLEYWGSDPANCSRDQIFAAQTAIVTYRDFERGRDLFGQFFKRGFLNQNVRHNWAYPGEGQYAWKLPDIPTPSQLSLMLRGLGNRLVYPFVFVLDAFMIADIHFFRRLDQRQLWDYDIKALPSLIAANSYLPTVWSRWALTLYLRDRHDIIQRIQHYNKDEFNGIQPLADLYDLALDKMKDQFIASPQTLGVPVSQVPVRRSISSDEN